MTLFHRLLRGFLPGFPRAGGDTVAIPLHDPFDGPVYAVGDIHGCLSLYRDLEALIVQDAAGFAAAPTLVLLGDLVDRGPQSAALIDHLLAPPPPSFRRLGLMGNHDAMMLDYLAAPAANADWLHLGGHETLGSYGLTADIGTLERMTPRKLQHLIAAHVPDHHAGFLRSLLPGLRVGRHLLAHAGADATFPLSAQPRQALLWGGGGRVAPDGLRLVHGHYVTPLPDIRADSIGIDTGAYATGRLTALRLLPDRPPAILTTTTDTVFKELAQS